MRTIAASLSAVALLVVGGLLAHRPADTPWVRPDKFEPLTIDSLPVATMELPNSTPGIARPIVVAAAAANLAASTRVVGVEIDGRARAYVVAAFQHPDSWLLNDAVADCGLAIVCPPNAPARVLRRGDGLSTEVALGWDGRLLIDGVWYESQQPLPLADVECHETTWRAWQRRHPDTEVMVGAADPTMAAGESLPQPRTAARSAAEWRPTS